MTLARLGLDCRIYYNAGAFNAPAWVLIPHVKDLSIGLTTGEADVSTRGTGGWRAIAQTLKELSIEFKIQAVIGDNTFNALRLTWFERDSIDVLVLDDERTAAGAQGLRAVCQCVDFSREEPLEEGVTYNVVLKATLVTPPVWTIIAN